VDHGSDHSESNKHDDYHEDHNYDILEHRLAAFIVEEGLESPEQLACHTDPLRSYHALVRSSVAADHVKVRRLQTQGNVTVTRGTPKPLVCLRLHLHGLSVKETHLVNYGRVWPNVKGIFTP